MVITIGTGFLGWLLLTVAAPLVTLLGSRLGADATLGLLQAVNFLITAAVVVLTGVALGRMAPQNFLPGLIAGRIVGFVFGTLYALQVMPRFLSEGMREGIIRGTILSLPFTLLWAATFTVTEAVIARWVARRTYGPA